MSAPGIRWSSVEWRDMPPPENTWVMLKSEGAEGEEQISSGFVRNGRSWGLTSYDGSPEASLNDHVPLSIFIGWAPTVTPSTVMKQAVSDIAQLAGLVMRADEHDTEQVAKNDFFRALVIYAKAVEEIHVPVLHAMLKPDSRIVHEIEWTPSPACCPFCGAAGFLRELKQWSALSSRDPGNTATLVEWRCHSARCGGRSFWL